jgi:glycosyltransferase involved in cell wall biosynthesis
VKVRGELGLGADEPTVGIVSRLARAKGYVYLLDAVPELVTRFPGVRFVIVGDGPERGPLEAKVEASGVADNVIFAGHRTDIDRILCAFDVFACPSLAEGMPYSVMEAMRAGLPIVASRVGGLPELLADGEAGVLVEAGDHKALAAAICDLLSDEAARATLGAAAHARVSEAFSLESMIDCTERVFEEALLDHRA